MLVGDLAADDGGRIADVCDVVSTTDEEQNNGGTVETMLAPVHLETTQYKPVHTIIKNVQNLPNSESEACLVTVREKYT